MKELNISKLLLFLTLSLFSTLLLAEDTYNVNKIRLLEVNSSINPATFNYLKSNLEPKAQTENELILIKLDTPGGLVSTTKDIITLIGSSSKPVVIWITPEGASATSAGAIIASSAHVLVMSEGTNIGAATPIQMGKDIQKDSKSKAVNDLVALVRSLSKVRGRNADEFEKMISQAKSIEADIALKSKVIDHIVNSQEELKKVLDGKVVRIKGNDLKLNLESPIKIKEFPMDLGQRILNVFSNPTTAYVLFIVGAALLYLEFQTAGGLIAGSLGAVCLILAGIGFQVLPLNFGAMGLIIVSFVLFILEAYITSYGILTIAGTTALTFGSLFLYRTENSYLDIEKSLVFSVVLSILAYVFFIGYYIVKTNKQDRDFFVGKDHHGTVIKKLDSANDMNIYQIKIHGEIWSASTNEELAKGDLVEVIKQEEENMILKIKKVNS